MVKLGSTGPIYPFSPSQNFIQFLSSRCLFFGARDGFSRFLTIRDGFWLYFLNFHPFSDGILIPNFLPFSKPLG